MGVFFSGRDWGTRQSRKKLSAPKYWDSINDNDSESQTGQKVHLPTGQQPLAHSQDNKGVATGQLCECPGPARAQTWTRWNYSGEIWKTTHRCSPSSLMELERSCKGEWEKPSKNRCAKLVASYSKKTLGCNCCQRCINKVLSQVCEYWCTLFIFFFSVFYL